MNDGFGMLYWKMNKYSHFRAPYVDLRVLPVIGPLNESETLVFLLKG